MREKVKIYFVRIDWTITQMNDASRMSFTRPKYLRERERGRVREKEEEEEHTKTGN